MQLSERIKMLELENVQLDAHTLQMIEASVRQKGIVQFTLTSNHFHGGEGVQFAVNVLKSNESVTKFCWCYNSFHSTEEACNLVDTVLEHQTTSSVEFIELSSLREFDGIDSYAPVKRLFDRTPRARTGMLLKIDLGSNGIKTNGDK